MYFIIIMIHVMNLCAVQCTQHIGHMDCLLSCVSYTWLWPREALVFAVLLQVRLLPRGRLCGPTLVLGGAPMRLLNRKQCQGCRDMRGGETKRCLKRGLSQNALHLVLSNK